MTHWDRVQAMQLELAQKEAHIRRLINELFDERAIVVQQRQNVTALSEEVDDLRRHVQVLKTSRDMARRVAIRLEEENHALAGSVCVVCAQVLVPVRSIGDAT